VEKVDKIEVAGGRDGKGEGISRNIQK